MLRSGDFQKARDFQKGSSKAQGVWEFLGFMKNAKAQLSKVCMCMCVWGGVDLLAGGLSKVYLITAFP